MLVIFFLPSPIVASLMATVGQTYDVWRVGIGEPSLCRYTYIHTYIHTHTLDGNLDWHVNAMAADYLLTETISSIPYADFLLLTQYQMSDRIPARQVTLTHKRRLHHALTHTPTQSCKLHEDAPHSNCELAKCTSTSIE